MRDERDERLDVLALRVAKVLDGENNEDVVLVCALIAVRALHDRYKSAERLPVLETVIDFMRKHI